MTNPHFTIRTIQHIYTRRGDQGKTSLLGGKRISKADALIEAYGTLDELNALLGLIRSLKPLKQIDGILERTQSNLFDLGVTLTAYRLPQNLQKKLKTFDPKETVFVEKTIDAFDTKNFPLRNFILPGGTTQASLFHVARTVCRRAERTIVKLKKPRLLKIAIPYLNRLGDLLFVLARYENKRAKKKEILWSILSRGAP